MESFIRLQSSITLSLARHCLDTALSKASDLNIRVSIAIVDASGHMIHMAHMDGAPPQCAEIALKKARTAVGFGFSTKLWKERLQKCSDEVKQGLPAQTNIALFGGGEPILMKDQAIGGIGVSGASESVDAECAQEAALRATELLARK
ncbi:heme-binding protein [Pseudomonas sp. WHRI 8519]|uniref:GlcG/HbpS family heme-binding protein n=1 Tax=Pseudomonas sp. WHRI 8519 TaxID=3162567 RepID=UPI0032EB5E03